MAMKIVMRFATLLTLLALAACGHDSNESAPPPAPVITTQPISATANAGGTATFTVVATGDGLSYQWKKNGTAITGATTASYTTPVLAASDDQSLYAVTVTNAGGSVTSNNATLTVTTTSPPGGGGNDGPLQPLSGATEPYPQTPAPLSATPTIAGVTPSHRYLLSWDPGSTGQYTFGFLHGNGAETRLFVPVASFLDELTMTTADVTSIGTAVTSVVAAVDIEPGDLVTEKTITANFMIPDALMATLDPAQLIGFAADSDGSNLHLVPIVVGNLGASVTRPALKLNRLGIVGIAVATPEQQAALSAAWPTDPEDRLNAWLAPSLTAKWRATVLPASSPSAKPDARTAPRISAAPADDNFATAALRGYYNDTVVPAFAAADGDSALIPAATQAGLSFLRLAALSGEDGAGGTFQVVAAQVWARIQALQERYADYLGGQCRANGGASDYQKVLGMMRQLQLSGNQAKSDELAEVLPYCSSFKVTFRYEYTHSAHWKEGFNCGPNCSGDEDLVEDFHAVVTGSQSFELGKPAADAVLRLTTLQWNRTRTRDGIGVTRYSYVPDTDTSPWRVLNLSVPVIRTRSGTPSTALTLNLPAFQDIGSNNAAFYHPFTVTGTSVYTTAEGVSSPPLTQYQNVVPLELFVPSLHGDGMFNFGPMLIPASGNATSSASRAVPLNQGQRDESETVTISVTKPQ
jgi:hypothetical protein